ncbi:MAG: class I SAM-dependent methyltransferase, partial [Bacteroidia bacterium]|nr:class I SAM-dependent methyltransferase [Bacteroidia bacterium]
MSEDKNILNRFSDRVENYVKFRPTYPEELFLFLEEKGILNGKNIIADIGSGTGISSEPFLRRGYWVNGVEPNDEMQNAAEKIFEEYENFIGVKGTAENTTLKDQDIDLVVAGQAFHWFDRAKAAAEFRRILKPGGKVLLMWNDRRTDTTDFLKVYEDFLMMFGTDYANVNHKNIQDKKIFD